MFEKEEYREMFSQVTASDGLKRRVMTMKQERNRTHSGRSLARVALVAALVALLAVSVSAAETVQSWFIGFFADKNGGELSQEQVEYIEENAQPILDSQTVDGWTVELRSAIHDGVCGYVLFHIEGPENVDLTEWTDENGNVRGQLLFGNSAIPGKGSGKAEFFKYQEELKYGGWGFTPMEDEDGLLNTADILVTLSPDMKRSTIDPFGPDALYHFSMENIVWFCADFAYEEELNSTKYAGQEYPQHTQEELQRIYEYETLAEGVWEFDIIFSELDCSTEYVELLTAPVTTLATVFTKDYDDPQQVTVVSAQLRHLSVTLTCAGEVPVMNYNLIEGDDTIYPCLVLKDGTEIMMFCAGSNGSGMISMRLEQPIVFEDVDHIRMADGTIIPVPEITE